MKTMKKKSDEKNERLARPEERLDLNAGYGPLRLRERRDAYESGRKSNWADSIGSVLQGISLLR